MAEPWDGHCRRCGGTGPFTTRKQVCKACYAAQVRAQRAADLETHRAKRRAEYAQRRAADPVAMKAARHDRWARLSPETRERYRQQRRIRLAARLAADPEGVRAYARAVGARYRARHHDAIRERQRQRRKKKDPEQP